MERKITLILAILIFVSITALSNATIPYYEKEKKPTDSLLILKNQAIRLAGEGNYRESSSIFRRILAIKRDIYPAKHHEIANTLVNIGVVYKKQGYYDKSLDYYEKAVHIYEKQEHPIQRKLGNTYSNMANIFTLQKDKAKAEIYYQKAIDLYQQDSLKNRDLISSIYNNLGILYNQFHEPEKSIDNYEKSLSIKKKTSARLYVTYGNLANAYQSIHQFEVSEKYLKKAIENIIGNYGPNSYHLAINYMNYGILKMQLNQYQEAENLFRESLKLYQNYQGENHPKTSKAWLNLGDLHYQTGDIKSSLHYYQKALVALSENFTDTSFFSNPKISEVFLKNRLLEILKRKAGKFAILGKNESRYLEESLKTYDLAIRVTKAIRRGYISEDSKLLLTSEERDTYMKAMDAALQLYKTSGKDAYLKKAFSYAEGSKAAVLYESIQSNQALMIGNIPDSLKEKENQLKKRTYYLEELIFEEKQSQNPDPRKLQHWSGQLFQAKKAYEALIQKFETQYPRFYQLKHNQEPVDIEDIQEKLGENEILIEYVFHKDHITTFKITPEDYSVHQIQAGKDFIAGIKNIKRALSARNFSTHKLHDFNNFTDTSYYLYSKLIEPLNLPENRKLTIIPDEQISYIPFEILTSNNPGYHKIDYTSPDYLLKDYKIGYAYSGKVLYNNLANKKRSRKKLAAFAPTYENIEQLETLELATRQRYREKLYPLKGIVEEVKKIQNIIPGDVFIDKEATEEIFKRNSQNYDILHLAMHTIINDKDPMFSKMAFTQSENEEEDGFLNTYEIYNLKLNSRMTVLSSCNTGTGKLRRGEGIMSLARGFKYAGCPSIVMTMWPVEDNSSITLMEHFYKALKKGMSKDKALREAKLQYLNNADPLHAHPYFWSGYILIGDKTAIYKDRMAYYYVAGVIILMILLILGGYYIRRRNIRQKG